MGYTDIEQSAAGGQPIELYDIAMGNTHWYITPNIDAYTYLTHEYTPTRCERDNIEQTGEMPKDSTQLTLPRGHELGAICIAGTPEEEVTLTIYRGHSNYFVKLFTGYLTKVTFNEDGKPSCEFEPLSSDLPVVGGRRPCMRLCPYNLYNYRCGIDRESYRLDGTIDSISNTTIVSNDFGSGSATVPVKGDLTKLTGSTYLASTTNGTCYVKYCFDDISRSYWCANTNSGYIQWYNPTAQKVRKVRIKPQARPDLIGPKVERHVNSGCNIRYFRIIASNNGSSWTAINGLYWYGQCKVYTGQGGDDTEILEFDDYSEWIAVVLDNENYYKYWRVLIYDNWGEEYVWCAEIEMIEADDTMSDYSFGTGGEIIVGTARRTILSQDGNTIVINRPFGSDVAVGDSFRAYAGCSHTPDSCKIKFDNMINYGGQPYLPVKNPYMKNLLY